MQLVHLELADANAFVSKHHRHHKMVAGHRFSLGAMANEQLVGVCIVGRPVARMTDQRNTVEVTRLATNGHKNACSFLYGAAAKAAKALGYKAIQTFILGSELGTSLKASGWTMVGETSGGSWSVPSRPREDNHPLQKKTKWSKSLQPASEEKG